MLIKLLPLLLALGYGFLMLQFSIRRTKAELAAKSQILRDDALLALSDRLAAALDLPQIKVNVFDVAAINGLAAPDGQIYLTRGFLEAKARGEVSAEELASVIAHELGHVALGHSRRRMIDFTGQNAASMMLSEMLNRFLPGIGTLIAGAISRGLMAHLSRRDEFEADAYAAALLAKAGIGTAPQKALLGKLAALTQTQGASAPAWLLSHPQSSDRIAAIEAYEQRWRLDQA